MTEKRRPTYKLEDIKRVFSTIDRLSMTGTALRTASELGFLPAEIVHVIQGIQRGHFVKSMTTYADHTLWQDVYYVPSEAGLLYVKFQVDRATEYRLVSFKERQDG